MSQPTGKIRGRGVTSNPTNRFVTTSSERFEDCDPSEDPAPRTQFTTAGGIRIQPDLTLEDLSATGKAMLILPGGRLWDKGENMEAVKAAKAVLASGGAVAAICGATAGLARGGSLADAEFYAE